MRFIPKNKQIVKFKQRSSQHKIKINRQMLQILLFQMHYKPKISPETQQPMLNLMLKL